MTQHFYRLLYLYLYMHSVLGAYKYMAQQNTNSSANLAKIGSTLYEDLVKACDDIGDNCVGFDSLGYLKSGLQGLTDNLSSSLWIKSGGPPPVEQPRIWPLPTNYSSGFKSNTLAVPFKFSSNSPSDIIIKAMQRYNDIIFKPYSPPSRQGDFAGITISIASNDETLQLETDESYQLVIDPAKGSQIFLTSKTVYGALRGLETLSQMIEYSFDDERFLVKKTPWTITDAPKFPFRGILIDTSRHYLPVSVIKQVIDSLSYAKLNVLHWHMVDAQSFPVESKKFPKLWDGSWTKRERYTQDMIIDIVQHAKERGVRIMAEFDGPGHAWSWGVGYPELLPDNFMQTTDCHNTCPTNPCNVPLDPTNEFTYTVLDGLLSELTGGAQGKGILPFDLIHLGGDEVEYGCWNSSAAIHQFMIENNVSFAGIYEYFVARAHKIAKKYGRTPVNWEEVFIHFGNKLDPSTIIHVWLDHDTLSKVVAAGYRGILSNNHDLYLDHLGTAWTTYYQDDPLESIALPAQQALVIGGEACMWGETVDSSDIFARIWPKAAAMAERLWNYNVVNHPQAINLAEPRMRHFRCLLIERGINAAPVNSAYPQQPSSCFAS